MRVILDLHVKNGKCLLLEVDNVSFSTKKIAFIFGDNIDDNGCTLYVFEIPDDGTEAYKILSYEAFEKGALDLRGYDYRMYDCNTMEEIFEYDEEV